MTKTDSVSIDGQRYDAVTGLPITVEHDAAKDLVQVHKQTASQTPAAKIHQTTQRSQTLQRKFVKKPIYTHPSIVHKTSQAKHMDIARRKSPLVTKYAPHPAGAVTPAPKSMDVGPIIHPHVAKAHAASEAKQRSLTQTITAGEIKHRAEAKAIASTHKKPQLKDRMRPKQRVVAILSATLAVVILAGYFTYLNMPALSVRVAAAQAGIDAEYPNYRPDGYALNGPVTYADGRVSMNFKANAGEQKFTINQSKSGWDSEAVLDNYIMPKAGSSYIPYTERGLTIYTYGDNAAWVNGGILYTVEGNAPLSNSQMRRIATSLL